MPGGAVVNFNIMEIATRIKGLREILNYSEQQMAEKTNLTVEEYCRFEKGETDFPVSFLYSCANAFGIDIIEIVTGENPKLKAYEVTRCGRGLPIKRREGFEHYHLAPHFAKKQGEPFLVTAPYFPCNEEADMPLSYHEGQEIDYILKGSLRIVIDGKEKILNAGDCIMYDSGKGHGMAAVGGEDCVMIAVIMKK